MYKTVTIFLFLLLSTEVSAKKITIRGNTNGIDSGSVELYLMKDGVSKLINSYSILKEHFTIELSIKEKNYYYITSEQLTGFAPFIPDRNITINVNEKDLTKSIIIGSQETNIFREYLKISREMGLKWIQIDAQRQICINDADSTCIVNLLKILDSIKSEINLLDIYTLKKNRTSYTALYILSRIYLQIQVEDFDSYLKILAPSFSKHSTYFKLKGKSILLNNTRRGKLASDFSIENLFASDSIKLSAFAGKYILLDFWGSWCGPCLSSIPKIKQLNDKYASTGLRIISIACDYRRNFYTILDLINKFKMTWTHCFIDKDNKFDLVVKNYSILSFPTYILVSPNKKILFRDNSNSNFDLIEKIIKDNIGKSNFRY